MSLFVSSIPYMLYCWIAVLMVPLVATGRIPAIGPMREAERVARNQGNGPTHKHEFSVDEANDDDGRVMQRQRDREEMNQDFQAAVELNKSAPSPILCRHRPEHPARIRGSKSA